MPKPYGKVGHTTSGWLVYCVDEQGRLRTYLAETWQDAWDYAYFVCYTQPRIRQENRTSVLAP